ncbi:hypothetical protein [Amaricoccus sp.]|uniref:hypothetical protein n=1 Tax=Amaricoccus sp. TaxID=1872485 RepID=UPI001B3CC217|nr:hypothetical protein [Amaricoccus sp.]MBP7002336.1 hypothetical protein [Amaricoccus sp.]
METITKIDDRLLRAMRQGAAALPEDLTLLRAYLRMIDALLAEKATELEPSWSQACEAAAEVETLMALEAAVTEKAIGVRARNLEDVRAKLEIWRALAAGASECDMSSPRDRLVLSIEADLGRIGRTPRAAPGV